MMSLFFVEHIVQFVLIIFCLVFKTHAERSSSSRVVSKQNGSFIQEVKEKKKKEKKKRL